MKIDPTALGNVLIEQLKAAGVAVNEPEAPTPTLTQYPRIQSLAAELAAEVRAQMPALRAAGVRGGNLIGVIIE